MRLHSHGANSNLQNWSNKNVRSVLDAVDSARVEFSLRVTKMRLGFQLLTFLDELFAVYLPPRPGSMLVARGGLLKLMVLTMKGRLEKYNQRAELLFKQLNEDKRLALCNKLRQFYQQLPDRIRREEDVAWSPFLQYASNAADADSASKIASWLSDYLGVLTLPLETVPLWDIWYTGVAPFPEELFNPSIRASILSGLLRPQGFTDCPGNTDPHAWEFPDTITVFQRYLESGKMINVYDWFESFKAVADSQGRQEDVNKREQDEKHEMELQARFMRSLHELELLGFTKPTRRKADHVLRAVFDVPDEPID